MMKREAVAWLAAAMAMAGMARGNVGVFRGAGQTPVADKTDAVQLVEETVEMRPREGTRPIDESARNFDPMDFRCRFLLRNLADEEVCLQAGFPLDSEDLWDSPEEPDGAAEMAERFRFKVRVNGEDREVRYAPHDAEGRWRRLFLWDMAFPPRGEAVLEVEYRMGGYFGLAGCQTFGEEPSLAWDDDEAEGPLGMFAVGIAEGHFYVTGTARCWAGEVERAVFRYWPREFEAYLRARGAFEENAEQRAAREAAAAKCGPGDARALFKPELQMVRHWLPRENEWREVADADGGWHLEWSRAPFVPDERDEIVLLYVAPPMPTAPEDVPAFVAAAEAHGGNARDACDVCREFYGVSTGNAAVLPFLRKQCWFGTSWRPSASAALLRELERAGKEDAGSAD